MTYHDRVDIALGSYKGKKYIREQVESIVAQTYPHWHLHIGDDGSTDDTPQVLEEIQKQYPDKITLHLFKDNVGISQNFSRLLDLTDAEYIMFCDQDDVWYVDKIEKSLNKIKEMEAKWGDETSLLVHTDMTVVDENLNVLAKSQWKRQKLNPKRSGLLSSVLVQNASWGCTLLFNRKLLNQATPIPAEAFMHDVWFALVASACGHVDYVKSPSMLYRQHASNWFGSNKINARWFYHEVFKNPDHQELMETKITKSMVRAYVLLKRYRSMLSDEQQEMLETFIQLKYQPWWKELYLRMRYGFYTYGFWPNLSYLIATLRMGPIDSKFRL